MFALPRPLPSPRPPVALPNNPCRLRQKEKLSWLEAELQRLRALCAAHNIDPSPTAPPPAAAAAAAAAVHAVMPLPAAAPVPAASASPPPSVEALYAEVEAILEASPAIPPTAAIAYLTASVRLLRGSWWWGWVAGSAAPHAGAQYSPPTDLPPRLPAVQAFQRADPATQRMQHSSLSKRFQAGRAAEVATCISLWLGMGSPAAAAQPAPLATLKPETQG